MKNLGLFGKGIQKIKTFQKKKPTKSQHWFFNQLNSFVLFCLFKSLFSWKFFRTHLSQARAPPPKVGGGRARTLVVPCFFGKNVFVERFSDVFLIGSYNFSCAKQNFVFKLGVSNELLGCVGSGVDSISRVVIVIDFLSPTTVRPLDNTFITIMFFWSTS